MEMKIQKIRLEDAGIDASEKDTDGDAVVKLSYQELFKLNNILYHAQKGGEIKDVVDFNIRRNFYMALNLVQYGSLDSVSLEIMLKLYENNKT